MADPEPELPRPLPPVPFLERARALLDGSLERIPLTALALLAAVAFVITWWLARPEPVAPSPPDEALPMATAMPAPTATPQTLVVHVAGAVRSPGVITVLEGTRVVDAIDLAGGFTPAADLTKVNLAGLVGDGERLWIPIQGEDEPQVSVGRTGASAGEPGAPGTVPAIVDLNTATVAELEALPGVGPATAGAIVEHRERNGPFSTVDDLLAVTGIGPAKLEAIRAAATV